MLMTTERIQFSHMPKCSGVYRLANTVTGESYIGASWDMRQRAKQHASQLRLGTHTNRLLLASYREHGIGSFEFEVVEKVRASRLEGTERDWIKRLQPAFNRCGKNKKFEVTLVIPIRGNLKRRIARLAKSSGMRTAVFARSLLERAVESAERETASTGT